MVASQNKTPRQKYKLFGHVTVRERRLLGISFLTIALIVVMWVVGSYVSVMWTQYNQVQQQSLMSPIRAMILGGVESATVTAPVDPKTGDVYLPPIKLRIPANYESTDTRSDYKYSWDASSRWLTVVDVGVIKAASTKLYNAHDLDDMFGRVPAVQACSRGVVLIPAGQEFEEGWKLEGSIQPGGDNTDRWDIYTDVGCPENSTLASILLGLKTY